MGPRFSTALAFAHELHGDQKRKGTKIPYIAHLLSVAALVIEAGGSEDAAIAALFHDAMEDQGGRPTLDRIQDRFGKRVATIVEECSDAERTPKPPWKKRKIKYIAGIRKKSRSARLVSLADKVHNARAILQDHKQIGDRVWRRFNGKRDGTLWYYRQLTQEFKGRTPKPLWQMLDEAVTELETLAYR